MGRMVFTVVGAVAELERSLIVERIHSGFRRARAQGRKPGRPAVPLDIVQVRRAVERHGSIRKAAKRLGCSEGTLRNRLAHA
jgi:DNA invertase Pin-like site-specific DNA recombinase